MNPAGIFSAGKLTHRTQTLKQGHMFPQHHIELNKTEHSESILFAELQCLAAVPCYPGPQRDHMEIIFRSSCEAPKRP